VVAAAREKEDPGCFTGVLNSLQTINKIPTFKLGDVKAPCLKTLVGDQSVPHVSLDRSAPASNISLIAGGASVAGENASVSVREDIVASDAPLLDTTESSVTSGISHIRSSFSKGERKKFPEILIFKKKSAPTITSTNLETLFRDGNIAFENNDGLSGEKCLKLLKGNLLECKNAITKSKIKDFRTIKSNNN